MTREEIKLMRVVDEFTECMKERLKEKMLNGYTGWDKSNPSTQELLSEINADLHNLLAQILRIRNSDTEKNCIDISNRIMMVWYRERQTKP